MEAQHIPTIAVRKVEEEGVSPHYSYRLPRKGGREPLHAE